MNRNNLLYLATGLLGGLIVGFIVANMVARAEINRLRAETKNLPGNTNSSDNSQQLSDEEIQQAIVKADAKQDDHELQKKFGLALYSYLRQEPNPKYLPDTVKVLKRAHQAEPKNWEILIALGESLLELGHSSEPNYFAEARTYYLKALNLKAKDPEVHTRIGQTYYFGQPPDINRAISEYRQSLSINSKYEPALQNLVSALISLGKNDEAQTKIEELEKLNPSNSSLPNLRTQLIQSRNATQGSK